MSAPIAVIDIGSNSIKILVAERTQEGTLRGLKTRTIDARIGTGINRSEPRLSDEGMERGAAAVRELSGEARASGATQVILVATSAVRDAQNSAVFTERIRNEIGYPVRILSGAEEANLIGRGLRCDPALAHLSDFSLFDLGGGSLECLSFRNGKIEQVLSLALGCVRLTERCVVDTSAPLSDQTLFRISELTKEVIAKSGFHFVIPPDGLAVGTGGTLATARAILGAREGKTLDETNTLLPVSTLRMLLSEMARVSLAERRHVPAMPAGRADVFPTALATFIALAEIGGIQTYVNSLYNLRWGVAAEAFQRMPA